MTEIKFKRGKIKRENESLFITEQNDALRTNYIKVKIDNTQKNISDRL